MVLLTLIIGGLNMCLGYALAVALGYGPPGMLKTWEALTVDPPAPGQDASGQQPFGEAIPQLTAGPGAETLPGDRDAETQSAGGSQTSLVTLS